MSKGRTYQVTHEGRTFTRTTHRTYTHVIICRRFRRDPTRNQEWGAWAWASRQDLADKQIHKALKIYEDAIAIPIQEAEA